MTRSNRYSPLIFVVPAAALTVVFVYYPLILNFVYSFYEFSAISPGKVYVGWENFKELIQDEAVRISLINNLKYAAISVFFQVICSFIIAAILEDRFFRKIAPLLRVLYFVPVLLSVTIVAFVFQFFYDPITGLFNQILAGIGLEHLRQPWLGSSDTAIYAVIAISQWQSMGYTALLFIVSIQTISKDLYEASSLDGASKIQQFIHVTLPQSKEILLVVFIVTVAQSFTVFGEPYILTGGGPGYSSSVLATYLYESAFNQDRMGYASAIAVVVFAMTMTVLAVQLRMSKTGRQSR
ncbi:putative ABC transporter permease protein YurN [Saccharospirillum salsuginis]|uniref:ABC transporter permease protein YurN n=2 Tax=Saccharospirillum salsuginis TaxID=418750 RepID=A0A918K2A7_9GAMM|nr:putative ABC transporter permease protein YurN [Saccharospirillum salsuginis]